MSGLKNTVNANLGIGSVVIPLLVLILMGLVFFILAIMSEMLKGGINRLNKRES